MWLNRHKEHRKFSPNFVQISMGRTMIATHIICSRAIIASRLRVFLYISLLFRSEAVANFLRGLYVHCLFTKCTVDTRMHSSTYNIQHTTYYIHIFTNSVDFELHFLFEICKCHCLLTFPIFRSIKQVKISLLFFVTANSYKTHAIWKIWFC